MSPVEIEKWMEKHDVTAVDIAAALRIHPRTVDRFLKGENVYRSTRSMIERFVTSHPAGIRASRQTEPAAG